MARWGKFKFGSGILYGSTDATDSNVLWTVEVDWTDTGYTGRNEASRVIDFLCRRGRDNFLRINSDGVANGFEAISAGSAVITLDDYDDTYNPYNVNSPLYPNVKPGHKIRVKAQNGTSGTSYPVFTGFITDIQPSGGTNRKAVIRAEDGLRLLADADVDISLVENYSQPEAMQVILDEIYPVDWGYSLDDVSDTVPYFWANGKALRIVNELADSELGVFFTAADGTAKYYARHHDYASVLSISQTEILKEINFPQPWDVVRNKIKVNVYPREEQATGTLWQMSAVPTITAGDDFTVWATYSFGSESPVPATDVITPVANTDFTFNSAADGSGVDLTSDLSISFTDFGSTAKIIMTNNGGTTGYMTLLKVRGNAIASPDVVRIIETAGAGDRALVLDNKWIQNANIGADFATYLVAWLQNVQIFPSYTVEVRFGYQFPIDLFDAVTLTSAKLGINGIVYRVSGIEHKWTKPNGQATRTHVTLEPLPSFSGSQFWIFPTELGVTSFLGF